MVRAALAGKTLNRGPVHGAAYVPAASVVAASLLVALPIVSLSGWWPSFGLLMFIAWRMLRADAWPVWWSAPLGLVNDLLTGAPIGMSMALWTAIMLVMDLVDRRTQWRDYWIEWAVASLLIAGSAWVEAEVSGLSGAPVRTAMAVPAALIEILTFPLAAYLAVRIDRWRLGR
ncbi:rod shape-determining protein MreD [Sphingomonas sp. HDW15A]|uniref:rod shape-determining protein MreD n=1 Tax=Sphingomonas sp. HDW15A TaxID=2714942 RepID=UPI00140A0A46|nr:rod shape-determining protein MreD [Sphingomonas sp. HDW15A]QIK95989.1 rod shape-determining protein MreD [Sphingomonas sp. HDW15A]